MGMLKLCAIVALTGLVGTACGSSATDQVLADDVPTQRSAAPDGWRPTAEDRQTLNRAELVLAAGCMRKLGFSFWTGFDASAPEPEFPHVIDDPAWARANGYGSGQQRRLRQEMRADPNGTYLSSLSASRKQAYTTAFFGTDASAVPARTPDGAKLSISDRGCMADARRSLFGNLEVWFKGDTIDLHLSAVTAPRTRSNPQYKKALSHWAHCVRRVGYSAADSDRLRELTASRVRRLPTARADELERRAATTEATCAVRSGLGVVSRRLEVQYRDAAERRFASVIRPLRSAQFEALPRATKLAGDNAGADR